MKPFIVTGCSQSGTTWVSELLTAAGLPCTHETHITSWDADYEPVFTVPEAGAGESNWLAAPVRKELGQEGAVIVKLVRPPLDVIRSMVGRGTINSDDPPPWVSLVDRHIGLFDVPAGPDRAAHFWLKWNSLVNAPDLVFRLGQIDVDDVVELGGLVGVEVDESATAKALTAPPTRPEDRDDLADLSVSLDDISTKLARSLKSMATRLKVPIETEIA